MRVRFTLEALSHLASIARYFRGHNASAALRVRAILRSSAERLGSFPNIGRQAPTATREWKVPGLPYVLAYEIHPDADEVVILAIFHEAQQRPGQSPARSDWLAARRCSTTNRASPAATMTPAPTSTVACGTSPKTSQPKATAQTISVYW
jgi:plasmid stabilization system protein ParE